MAYLVKHTGLIQLGVKNKNFYEASSLPILNVRETRCFGSVSNKFLI